MVKWNKTSLTQTNSDILDCKLPFNCSETKSLQSFWIVLDYGISYYRMVKGISILFLKDDWGDTLIQDVFKKLRQKDVMDFVEETLSKYSTTTPINNMDVLMLAEINQCIHFDCVCFLLR